MKSKKIIFVIFGAIILLIPLYIIFQSENILENGHRHKLKLEGYDPFDPFRGKFLRLSYDNFVTYDVALDEGDMAFVTLEKDSEDFSSFAHAYKEKPTHDDYLMAEIQYLNGEEASLKIDNLTKYFINENKAKEAEEVLRDDTLIEAGLIYAIIRVLDGEARLEDIYVGETPLLIYLEEN